MSGASAVHLTLPQWDGGSRKIRYLYLADATSFRLAESHDEGTRPPLYLGADLFSNTDIRTENHPRYHAKFAKKGLATKIHFSPEFRFHGLKVSASSNSLWFYSVQGLFRVAFELYSKKEQLDVLEKFQDVWKSRINDKPLEMSYSLCKQLDSVTPEVSDAEPKIDIMTPQDCQTGQDSASVGGFDTVGTSADHDYCSFPQQCLQTDSCQTVLSTVRQTLHCLDDKLSSGIQSLTEQQLETILLFLDHIERYIYGQVEEKDVTDLVSTLLKTKEWGCVYSSSLLNCVACWLGQQFHAAKDSISHKVEGFKVRHIERISELPPAGELATQLFPEAMQTLLLHWMGLNEESTLEKRHSESPILLLILEFANHNLITGVAHVLYSSLICK